MPGARGFGSPLPPPPPPEDEPAKEAAVNPLNPRALLLSRMSYTMPARLGDSDTAELGRLEGTGRFAPTGEDALHRVS